MGILAMGKRKKCHMIALPEIVLFLSTLVLTKMTISWHCLGMTSEEPSVIRVSISEASRLFGIHQRTIRRAITDGELRYIVVRGRYKLHFESLVVWSQRSASAKQKRDSVGIGQWVTQWKIRNPKFSPRPPST